MEEKNKKIEEIKKRVILQRKKKIRIFKYFFLIGIILCSFFFIRIKTLKFLWNLETFRIKEIKIYPEDMTKIIELIEIEKNKNLLFLDADNLMEKINSISEIDGCKIIKKFPSTLEIIISLRKPWAILKYDEKEFLIDKNGVVLSNEGKNIPSLLIYGIKVNEKENKVEENEKIKILSEIERWYNYFNIGNYFKIKKIDISELNKIEISDGEKSVFFTEENIKIKMEKLLTILKKIDNNFEYIDTRFKNFYIKLKK